MSPNKNHALEHTGCFDLNTRTNIPGNYTIDHRYSPPPTIFENKAKMFCGFRVDDLGF